MSLKTQQESEKRDLLVNLMTYSFRFGLVTNRVNVEWRQLQKKQVNKQRI